MPPHVRWCTQHGYRSSFATPTINFTPRSSSHPTTDRGVSYHLAQEITGGYHQMANKLYLARQAHPGFTLFCIEQILLGAYEATRRSAHGNNRPASSNSINDANISKGRPRMAAPTFTFLPPEGTCEFSPRYTHPAPGSAGRSSAPPGWCPLKSLGTPIG